MKKMAFGLLSVFVLNLAAASDTLIAINPDTQKPGIYFPGKGVEMYFIHPCDNIDPSGEAGYLRWERCVQKNGLPPKEKQMLIQASQQRKGGQDCSGNNVVLQALHRLEMGFHSTNLTLRGIQTFSEGAAQPAWQDEEHKRMAHEAYQRAQKQMEDLKKQQAIVGEVAVQKAREISAEFDACRGSKSACAPTVSDPPRRGLP